MSKGKEEGLKKVQRHGSRFEKCPMTGKGAPIMSKDGKGGSENVARQGRGLRKCPKTQK